MASMDTGDGYGRGRGRGRNQYQGGNRGGYQGGYQSGGGGRGGYQGGYQSGGGGRGGYQDSGYNNGGGGRGYNQNFTQGGRGRGRGYWGGRGEAVGSDGSWTSPLLLLLCPRLFAAAASLCMPCTFMLAAHPPPMCPPAGGRGRGRGRYEGDRQAASQREPPPNDLEFVAELKGHTKKVRGRAHAVLAAGAECRPPASRRPGTLAAAACGQQGAGPHSWQAPAQRQGHKTAGASTALDGAAPLLPACPPAARSPPCSWTRRAASCSRAATTARCGSGAAPLAR